MPFLVLYSVPPETKKEYGPESSTWYFFVVAVEGDLICIDISSCVLQQIAKHYSCCWALYIHLSFMWESALFEKDIFVSLGCNEWKEHEVSAVVVSIEKTSHSKYSKDYFLLWPCRSRISSILYRLCIFLIWFLIAITSGCFTRSGWSQHRLRSKPAKLLR